MPRVIRLSVVLECRCPLRAILASVADHPGARGRKALRSASGPFHKTRRLGRATTAARRMRRLVFAEGLRRIRATLVGGMSLALVGGHTEEIWRRQNHAWGFTFALWTVLRRIAFRHRPHVGERAAIVAKIFIHRHFFFPVIQIHTFATAMRGGNYSAVPHPSRRELFVL
jgi:hypothetical protein